MLVLIACRDELGWSAVVSRIFAAILMQLTAIEYIDQLMDWAAEHEVWGSKECSLQCKDMQAEMRVFDSISFSCQLMTSLDTSV